MILTSQTRSRKVARGAPWPKQLPWRRTKMGTLPNWWRIFNGKWMEFVYKAISYSIYSYTRENQVNQILCLSHEFEKMKGDHEDTPSDNWPPDGWFIIVYTYLNNHYLFMWIHLLFDGVLMHEEFTPLFIQKLYSISVSKNGGNPDIIIHLDISIVNQPWTGDPPFMEPPIYEYDLKYLFFSCKRQDESRPQCIASDTSSHL